MNKTELIAAVAEKAELSKKDAEKAVNALLDTVVEEVAKGEKIQLVGFGTFERRERKEREGAQGTQASLRQEGEAPGGAAGGGGAPARPGLSASGGPSGPARCEL